MSDRKSFKLPVLISRVFCWFGEVNQRLRRLEFKLLWVFGFALLTLWASHGGEAGFGVFVRWVPLEEIHHEFGMAYQAKLPNTEDSIYMRSSRALLCEGVRSQRKFFAKAPEYLKKTRIFYYLSNQVSHRFRDWQPTSWECFPIENGNQPHPKIRDEGGGLYSIEEGWVNFSIPDNSDPTINGRHYALAAPKPAHAVTALGAKGLTFLFGLVLAYVLLFRRVFPRLEESYASSRIAQSLAPGMLSSIVVLLVIGFVSEGYLRLKIPFTETQLPLKFDPRVGSIYQPSAISKWTDHSSFWSVQRSNSLGFFDREPVIPKPDDIFRILFIGDSFIEALQVAIEDKVQVRLEKELRRRLNTTKVDTAGFGYSGTGQANQLAYLAAFGEALQPDLIILLVVNNDFRDNSTWLQAIHHGRDPYHPKRLFFEPGDDGEFERINIDPKWSEYQFDAPSGITHEDALRVNQNILFERYPGIKPLFGNWRVSDALDMDKMFYTRNMPPIFERARASSEHAFVEFRRLADQRGSHLLVVATDSMTKVSGWSAKLRIEGDLQVERLKGILNRHDIAFLDLYPIFSKRGDPRTTRFTHDGHWNETGHKWAAEALADYLIENPRFLKQR